MAKTMLIDATHPEETRVAVVDGRKLEEFDVEVANRRPLKGNIYLAKVTRVEPSLQAAFVEYGGNRHGFLAFSEIHPDYYRIPVADREALLREAAESLDDDDEIDLTADSVSVGDPVHDHHDHDHDDDHHDHHHHDDHDHADHDHAGDVIVSESGEFVAAPAAEGLASVDAAHEGSAESASPAVSATSAVMALEVHREVLQGEIIDAAAPAFASEQAGDTVQGHAETHADQELPAATQGEIVEMPARDDAVDTLGGGNEAPIQDDPEADEERARRRRQRNLRRYKIQEVIKRRQILLVQVTKEERGNKGAALTTYLSLAGRYCVLMPNTDRGGGISRRITNATDRKRLKSIIDDLDAPEGMAVIVRTAGSERSKAEVKRDFEYLLRLWDEIRDVTLRSTAPALIYEEASLIKRSIRDLYTRDIGDIIVAGEEAYRAAKSFMRTLTPSHAKRVQLYRDNSIPLFQRYQIESQLAAIHQPVVQLKSGGYIVINQTEALVAIDVNSGRSTKERNIEETALRTNQEAAEEVARQLRLRDLAGLIVIDFIDMEENRNNAAVERRLKESLKNDRARIQIGRISSFGLLEMSRQRLHPSLAEASTEICAHCAGTGRVRSVDSTALHVLRMVEEEITRSYSPGISVFVPTSVALYILNQKRMALAELEMRRGVRIYLQADDGLIPPDYRLERIKQLAPGEEVQQRQLPPAKVIEEDLDLEDDVEEIEAEEEDGEAEASDESSEAAAESGEGRSGRRRRRRRRGGRGEKFRADEFTEAAEVTEPASGEERAQPAHRDQAHRDQEHLGDEAAGDDGDHDDGEDDGHEGADASADGDQQRRRRRRGRRGGRRRSRRPHEGGEEAQQHADGEQPTDGAHATDAGQPIAGFGDQPSLPDTLPPHWQQQTAFVSQLEQSDTDHAAVHAGDTVGDRQSAADAPVTAEASAPAPAVATAVAGDATPGDAVAEAEPAAAVESTEAAAPRRRTRREDGERAPRTRKPRRSRDEAAAEEAQAASVAAEAPTVATPVEALAEAPVAAAPQPELISVPSRAEPAPAVAEAAATSVTVIEVAGSGDPAVTVLEKESEASNEPKRRGWWRRLVE